MKIEFLNNKYIDQFYILLNYKDEFNKTKINTIKEHIVYLPDGIHDLKLIIKPLKFENISRFRFAVEFFFEAFLCSLSNTNHMERSDINCVKYSFNIDKDISITLDKPDHDKTLIPLGITINDKDGNSVDYKESIKMTRFVKVFAVILPWLIPLIGILILVLVF